MKPKTKPPLALSVLVEELRDLAEGDYGVEAAVELLVDHGTWLHRRDFRSDAVWVSDIPPRPAQVDRHRLEPRRHVGVHQCCQRL